MRNISFLLFFVVACQSPTSPNKDAGTDVNNVEPPDFMEFPAIVAEVIDGDTIWVWFHGKRIKVRFTGVDTPETYPTVEFYGPEATEYTRSRLPAGSWVGLEFDDDACGQAERPRSCGDTYDRLLAYIRTLEEDDLNALLVVNGYARVYTQATFNRKTLYLQLQDEASQAGRGIWSQ